MMSTKNKEINRACDAFLESRGWPKLSFKQSIRGQVRRAVGRKRRRERHVERVARELEEAGE